MLAAACARRLVPTLTKSTSRAAPAQHSRKYVVSYLDLGSSFVL